MHNRHRIPGLAVAVAAFITADVIGLVGAVVTGRASLADAVASGTPLNAPVPFMAVQLLVTAGVLAWRGAVAGRLLAGLLALLCLISVASGFGDGGYGDPTLSAAGVAVQVAIVVPSLAAAALAARLAVAGTRSDEAVEAA
jgi:hypothetical protein